MVDTASLCAPESKFEPRPKPQLQYRISVETPDATNPTRYGGWDAVGGLDGDLVITGRAEARDAARRVAKSAPRTAQVIIYGPLGRKSAKRKLVK